MLHAIVLLLTLIFVQQMVASTDCAQRAHSIQQNRTYKVIIHYEAQVATGITYDMSAPFRCDPHQVGEQHARINLFRSQIFNGPLADEQPDRRLVPPQTTP